MLIWWLDDEIESVMAVVSALEESNVSVRRFISGDELLRCVESEDQAPSLTITDVMVSLHGDESELLGGLTVAEALRSHPRSRTWPVLICTAYSLNALGDALPSNIVGVLSKRDHQEHAVVVIESALYAKDAHDPKIAMRNPFGPRMHLVPDLIHALRSVLRASSISVQRARSSSGKERDEALTNAQTFIEQAIAEVERARLIDGLSSPGRTMEASASAEALRHMGKVMVDRQRYRRSSDRSLSVTYTCAEPPDGHRKLTIAASALAYVFSQLTDNAVAHSTGSRPFLTVEVEWAIAGATLIFTNSGSTVQSEELSLVGSFGWQSVETRRRNPNGRGTGLWLVKQLLEQSGGLIDFQISEAPSLSIVSVFIPWAK